MNKHLICFENTWNCLAYRAPVLLWIAAITIWIAISNAVCVSLFGSIMLDHKEFIHINDTTVQVVTSQVKLDIILQTLYYAAVSLVGTFFALIFGMLLIDIFKEIKSLKTTIKECSARDR